METAKIFQNGQSQAVRLPRQFRFACDRVAIKKVGNAVVLFPPDAPRALPHPVLFLFISHA